MGLVHRDSQKTKTESSLIQECIQDSWTLDSANHHGVRRWMVRIFGKFGTLEPMSQPVDNLLDRKQRDKYAAHWNRRVQRCNRRQRRHAKAGKSTQEIQIAEIDKAYRDAQYDEPGEEFDGDPGLAMKTFGDCGEIKMIIATRSYGSAEEDRINEQRRRHLLQPKPRVTDRPRDNVENTRAAKRK